jgi:predicted DCC family thiol-disulfide oxidoreductase YuxK
MQTNTNDDAVPAAARENAVTTVYYDGACPVCSREIAAYRRLVGAEQCAWVDASSCAESALGAGLSRKAALARFHVRRADGVLVDGTRGFAALWCVLPRVAWLGRIASVGAVAALLDLAYGVFLRVRALWQRARTAPALKELS